MLVLTRRVGEEIVIGENVHLTVVAVHGNRVRLGFTAPQSVLVQREEIRGRKAGVVVRAATAAAKD